MGTAHLTGRFTKPARTISVTGTPAIVIASTVWSVACFLAFAMRLDNLSILSALTLLTLTCARIPTAKLRIASSRTLKAIFERQSATGDPHVVTAMRHYSVDLDLASYCVRSLGLVAF